MSAFSGAYGEVMAARYLRDRGYKILTANYRTRFGEIDIVAMDKKTYVFVEVKTRSPGAIAEPAQSVTADKQRKLSMAAAQYLQAEPRNSSCRFDVMEVYLTAEETVSSIHHIQNAFEQY